MIAGRRLLLAAPLLLLPGAGQAKDPPRAPLRAQLRPGVPPSTIRLVVEDDPERLVRLRVTGAPGAPASAVIIPTRYGGSVPLRVLRLGNRDILLAETDGNGGTGIAQRLGVVIAMDDAGALRVIGIESLQIQESTTCDSEATQTGTLSPAPEGLRFAATFRRRRGECGFRWRGRPQQERWDEVLRWDGSGALAGPAPPPGAGAVRKAIATARGRIAGMLVRPVTDLRTVDLLESGIFDLANAGPP